MKNQLRIFESEDFGTIRVVEIDGEPWWVLKDMGDPLSITDISRLAERVKLTAEWKSFDKEYSLLKREIKEQERKR